MGGEYDPDFRPGLMSDSIYILTVERDGDDGLIVTFSDGTTGAYVIEELLELRPFRERAKTKIEKIPINGQKHAPGINRRRG
jgi:hypothetical protein